MMICNLIMRSKKYAQTVQYICAVILIISSIILAYIQVIDIDTIANGTLMYIAQAFLLAGSIFGLDYYVQRLHAYIDETKGNSERDTK